MQQLKTSILNCLQNLKGSGKFAAVHTTDFELPGLVVDEVGEIAFPLTEQQAQALIKAAHQAPFGKGSKTVLDTNVRSAWEINAGKLRFSNPKWATFLEKTVQKVKEELGLADYTIEANLYKLLLYENGDFFLPHKDSEKEKGMFGTLIIGLPSKYSGGELVVRFDGEEVVADFTGDTNAFNIHCAAFYADCDHEVKPLTSGYRICLAYNLVQQKAGAKIELQSLNSYADKLVKIFSRHPGDKPHIVLLGHQYTPENFSCETLKLNDRYKADALMNAAEKLGHYAKLCLVTSYKSGAPEYDGYYEYGEYGGDDDAVMVEVYDESLSIEHWGNSTTPALDTVAFEEDDLIASFTINEDEPIVKESTGYMGNYGPDLMHWYHYGAVMIWSKEQNALLLHMQSTVTQLEWIAYFNRLNQVSKTEIKAVNALLYTGLSNDKVWITNTDADFSVVADWLIKQNDQTFFLHAGNERLQFFFEKIGTTSWQKVWEWLPGETSLQVLEKLTSEPKQEVFEKLTAIIRSLAASPGTVDLAKKQTAVLSACLEQLGQQSSVRLKSDALSNLFWIENRFLPGQTWIDILNRVLTANPNRTYIHNVLAPRLMAENRGSGLHRQMLEFCNHYLKQRVGRKPNPPADWSRPLPKASYDKQVWEILRSFMESPVEQVFDFKAAQDKRTLVEQAIKRAQTDLKTQTIKKGSPHTLRITKTQASYRRQLKKWEEDVELLEQIQSV